MKARLLLLTLWFIALTCIAAHGQEFYKADEFAVDAFGGIVTEDLDSEQALYGFGVQYYLTKNLGAGVYTSLGDLSGKTFDNVSVRGLWRVPYEKHALYFFGGVTRQLDGSDWSLQLGPGYEFRPIDHIGLFAEVGMNKVWTGDERPLAATVRGGIRFSF